MRAGGVMRGRRRPLEWEAAVVETLALVWRCRLELVLLGVGVGLQRVLAMRVGDVAAGVVVGVVVAVVLAVGPARRVLWRGLRRAWVARAWARAATDSGLAHGPFRVPRVLGVMRVPAGEVVRVRMLRGQSALALDARREELAACLCVREVRVERAAADAADVRVTLVRRDPFEDVEPIPWPALEAQSLSLWESITDWRRRTGRVRVHAAGRAQRVGRGRARRGQVRRAVVAGRGWRA
jgi:hypothetical protein